MNHNIDITSSTHLHLRPARPSDRDAVVAMVASVWDGNDYVPDVWDAWLADPSGPLLVGELDGQPVALAKISQLNPGEDWFHGLRVAPEQRGRGFARAMLHRCAELSRERDAHALRYLTSEDNPPMHRIGEQLGFRLVYAPAWYKARGLAGTPSTVALPPERHPALMDDLGRSPLLACTGGLYSYDWLNLELTEAQLLGHLKRGEVLALPDEDAWAIVVPREEGGVWLAHVEGTNESLGRLAAAIRRTIPPGRDVYARALLPPGAPCIPTLLAAGFAGAQDPMRVYELGFPHPAAAAAPLSH